MKSVFLMINLLLWIGLLSAQEKTYRNSIGMEFVLIPAQPTIIGTNTIFQVGNQDEAPQHRVRFDHSFYLGKYEVTQAQWVNVMGYNPSKFEGDNHPVEQVSWEDVQRFISILNHIEKVDKYRLPTEAEWEHAARAGTETSYFFGDDAAELRYYAWYNDNSEQTTHSVGQKDPNPWGLYDIYGNVWEWVQDWYHHGYYVISSRIDPKGPLSGYYRVNRGGSWYSRPFYLRSAKRGIYGPNTPSNIIGFRLLRLL